jgi:hypothetical protein
MWHYFDVELHDGRKFHVEIETHNFECAVKDAYSVLHQSFSNAGSNISNIYYHKRP